MTNRVYFAYLLRLWCDHPGSPWRAMLEDPRTGERLTFASIKELTRFLADKTADAPHATTADEETHAPHSK